MDTEKKSHGALIGSIIVIIILIIGGIYVWQTKVKEIKLEQQKVQMQAQAINAASLNELNTLEEDLKNTDVTIDINADTIK
ncbi:MAG: hypothetical protein WCI93_00460 [bacterium]